MHNVIEPEIDCDDTVALEVCPACSALNVPIGCLGTMLVLRCVHCGTTWQQPAIEAL